MFGVLRARPRFWLSSHSLSYVHATAAASFHRLPRCLPHPTESSVSFRARSSGAASVWHTILPSYWRRKQPIAVFGRHEYEAVKHGEGSWNVAWDARPARWLHHPNSAWLLFGVSAAAPLIDSNPDSISEVLVVSDDSNTSRYRVTGVRADGRCLFRAIAHMACLRKGEKAPDEIRQQELADELRAQVVEELLKRRKEVEWFIEEEFDVYVKSIEQPYIWGGEPELLMCSHVLRTPICVFMKDKSTGKLTKIANYGEEYRKAKENSIDVLFHGYGHYDVLEAVSYSSKMGLKAKKAGLKNLKKAAAQFSASKGDSADFLSLDGGSARNIPETENGGNKSTVLYIGRIPHGFYETEMEAFFKQFGAVKRLRIARNRKTGKSKHFGFIEFQSPKVAKVVEECMHNYLMYEHLLQVSLVPPEHVHPRLWKGMNRSHQLVNWVRFERKRHDKE